MYRANDLILDHGGVGDFDELGPVLMCPPIKVKDIYYLYYRGLSGLGVSTCGLATSKDGVGFTKHPNNPVIPLGSVGAFDESNVIPVGSIYIDPDVHKAKASFSNMRKWYVFYIGEDLAGDYKLAFASGREPASLSKGGVIVTTLPGTFFIPVVPIFVEYRENVLFNQTDWEQEKSNEPIFILRYTVWDGVNYFTQMAQVKLW